jgi:hypothetical protein
MQLRRIRGASAWITAGGALKLPAIWTLAITRALEQEKVAGSESIMGQLTTDSATAQDLVRAKEAFEKASRPIKQWYADVTAMIFAREMKNAAGSR